MITRVMAVIIFQIFTINPCYAVEKHNSEFRKLITKSIFKVVKASGDKISISANSVKANNDVIIYINGYDLYESITCQKVEDLHLFNRPSKTSSKHHIAKLKVGLCPNEEGIGNNTIQKIETTISNEKIFNRLDETQKKEVGLYIIKEHINDGTKKIYYPGIAIGHGVTIIRSYIFFPADNKYSLVIQYAPTDSGDIDSPLFYTVKNNINGIAAEIIQGIIDDNYK